MTEKTTAELFSEYKDLTQKAADFNNAAAVLGWDQEVYMPPKGYAFRGRQLATLAAHAHELVTSEGYGNILQELIGRSGLADEEHTNVVLSFEDYEKNKKLSSEFVEQITQQTSNSYNAWIKAREQKDFSLYASELERMVVLKKKQAELYGYAKNPYDALLDDYEKGASVGMLGPIFQLVKDQLTPFLKAITTREQVNDSFFYQPFPRQVQWDFSVSVLKQMGYDFEAGRQDYSEHPFSTSFAPSDVRVTTRVDENNLASLLWSSIHEGGHALYEQGLPESQYGMPLGAAVSLSIHESQSRLWENCVGRSLPFWRYFYPKLQQIFSNQLGNISLEHFYRAMNKVEPSLIRTEADEVTYHFHVMIRFEIEKALLNGEIKTGELNAIWNENYMKYFGLAADDDKKGVLQDVHWSHGSFGYFPTYSLGSFYAAQFFQQATSDIPDLQGQIEQGHFKELLRWLRVNVHQHGRRYRSEELCKRITGRGLDFSSFMSYIEGKYAEIYSAPVNSNVG